MFNYVCKDILIDNFEYMTADYKWQVILTDFNMWVPLGCVRLLVESLTS